MFRQMLCSFVLLALVANTQGRAINISNTWVLPEEGFPVFYRYFRDRISWYEADAVCQFHHANLVTVDTTAQYDAVRAYLKELDISSAVWVGLIRSNPDGDFTWTDYRGMSNDGYWSAAPDARAAPLCAATDPAADYRWQARACGGPSVASFICELPVPKWALGNSGCMVKAIPALTVLYLPESAAVQLTADCGMADIKRVQCTGNVEREDLLRNLSCAEDAFSTVSSAPNSTTYDYYSTTDEDTSTEITADENVSNSHETISSKLPTPDTTVTSKGHYYQDTRDEVIKLETMLKNPIQNNINLDFVHDNNLQSNDIPKNPDHEDPLIVEQTRKLEDEKNMQHKLLHDELAKHGNFETIFSQSTDHFVPPLVMAKAKISDDMTVLSLAEKHAQQLMEQRLLKPSDVFNQASTDKPDEDVVDKPLVITIKPSKYESKKDTTKLGLPKKYLQKDKYDNLKYKSQKIDNKLVKFENTAFETPIEIKKIMFETTTVQINQFKEDPFLELTVKLKEPDSKNSENITDDPNNFKKDAQKIEAHPISVVHATSSHANKKSDNSSQELPSTEKITLTNQVIKITLISDDVDESMLNKTVFEITTRVPETETEAYTQATANDLKTKAESTIAFTTKSDVSDVYHVQPSVQPTVKMSDAPINLSKEEFKFTDKQTTYTTAKIPTEPIEIERQTKTENITNVRPENDAGTSLKVDTTMSIATINNKVTDFLSTKNEATEEIPHTTTPIASTEINETPVTEIRIQAAKNLMHEMKIPNYTDVVIKSTVTDEIDFQTMKNKIEDQTVTEVLNEGQTVSYKIEDPTVTPKIEGQTVTEVLNEGQTVTGKKEGHTMKNKIEGQTVTGKIEGQTMKNKIESQTVTEVLNDDEEINSTEKSLGDIVDFQSPLLSAANEPLRRPSRSRRPQIQNKISKFNPFRILG